MLTKQTPSIEPAKRSARADNGPFCESDPLTDNAAADDGISNE